MKTGSNTDSEQEDTSPIRINVQPKQPILLDKTLFSIESVV